jgi:hypothetical protein
MKDKSAILYEQIAENFFLFCESKKKFLKKAKTRVVLTLFMNWATY